MPGGEPKVTQPELTVAAVFEYLDGPRHGIELFQQVEPTELSLRAAVL